MKSPGGRLMLQGSLRALAVVFTGLVSFACGQPTQPNSLITIVTVGGQNARNILQRDMGAQTIVEVHDSQGAPVPNARVTFTAPSNGPRVVFAGKKDTLTVTTASDGRAASGDVKPLGTGAFDVTVRATYHGHDAVVNIRQTNFLTLVDSEANERGGRAPMALTSSDDLFKIEVLQGDDGVNIIDKDSAVTSLVRVVDKNNLPVAGIAITVAIVAVSAAEGGFDGGKKTATVVTGADGLAQIALSRISGEGPVQLQMHAVVHGQTLRAAITQTNYINEGTALAAGKTPGASKINPSVGQTSAFNPAITNAESTKKVTAKSVTVPSVSVQTNAEPSSQPPSSCLFGPCGLSEWQPPQGGLALPGLAVANAPLFGPMGFPSESGFQPPPALVASAQASPSQPASAQTPTQSSESKQKHKSLVGGLFDAGRISLSLSLGSPWVCGAMAAVGSPAPASPFVNTSQLGLVGPSTGSCGGPFGSMRMPSLYLMQGSPLLQPTSASLPSSNGLAFAPPTTQSPGETNPPRSVITKEPVERPTDDSASLVQKLGEARDRIRHLRNEQGDLGREAAGLEHVRKLTEVKNQELRQKVLGATKLGPGPAKVAGVAQTKQANHQNPTRKGGSSKPAATSTRATPPPRIH